MNFLGIFSLLALVATVFCQDRVGRVHGQGRPHQFPGGGNGQFPDVDQENGDGQMPEFPSINMPDLSDLPGMGGNMPQMPNIQMPDIQMPDIRMPNFHIGGNMPNFPSMGSKRPNFPSMGGNMPNMGNLPNTGNGNFSNNQGNGFPSQGQGNGPQFPHVINTGGAGGHGGQGGEATIVIPGQQGSQTANRPPPVQMPLQKRN